MLFRLRMTIDEAIAAYRGLATGVFSDKKWIFQDGTFKATRLEDAIVRVIKENLKIESDINARQVLLYDEHSPKW